MGYQIRRGTTPTWTFRIKKFDISNLKNVYITFAQKQLEIITKSNDDVIFDYENNALKCELTQEETLMFDSQIDAEFQIRASTNDNKTVGSKPYSFDIGRIIKDGVIE